MTFSSGCERAIEESASHTFTTITDIVIDTLIASSLR
jgi:hypothetical protein